MKILNSKKMKIAGVFALLFAGFLSISFQDPLGYELQFKTPAACCDTVPTKKPPVTENDISQVMDEALQLAAEALKKVDFSRLQAELRKLDLKAAMEDAQKALKQVDMEKLRQEIRETIEESRKDWTEADKQKLKAELEKAKAELKKLDMDKLMEDLRKQLEKARQELEKAKKVPSENRTI